MEDGPLDDANDLDYVGESSETDDEGDDLSEVG